MRRLLAVILSLALFALGACKGTPSRRRASGIPNPPFIGEVAQDAGVCDCAPGRYGGTLVMATPYNPETFNIITAQSDSTPTIVDHIVFNSITGYDNYTKKVIPELARSWEASPDGLIWTIYLRKGVLWSDGVPFNADDVMFSYQVMSDPEIASSERDSFLQLDGSVPSIEKVDDFTVRFHLRSPFDFSAALNDLHPVPKHKWESVYKAGDFRHAMSISGDIKDVIGTGPYRLVSFAADQQITLERNPYYWRVDKEGHRLPWIDKVTFLVVPNNNTWNLKMENGDLDIYQKIQEGADELKRFEKKADFKVYPLGLSFTVNYVAFNQDTNKDKNGKPHLDPMKLKWFRDVKFRQAVSYAIDRDAMIRTALSGHGQPVWEPESPGNKPWYDDAVTKRPYDPEKAKELLKEIGIYDRNGDGIAEDADGNPIKFSLMTNSNNSVRVNMIALVKDNLKKIGMDVTLDPVDSNLMAQRFQFSRDFDAVLYTWEEGQPPDPILGKNILLPSGELYVAFPRQKEPSTEWEKQLQSLLIRSMSTLDLATRQRCYRQAMELWSEYLPEIDLVSADYFAAAKNNIGNLKPSALPNYLYWNLDELYFKN